MPMSLVKLAIAASCDHNNYNRAQCLPHPQTPAHHLTPNVLASDGGVNLSMCA